MAAMRRLLPFLIVAALAVGAAPAGAAPKGFRATAVNWAVEQAGHRERGTTNCSKRIIRWERAMGFRVPPCRPWCGALVHQAFLRAGVRLSRRLIAPHKSYADAVARRRGLRRIPVEKVRTGDLVFFRFRSGVRASHLAIVRDRPWGGRVSTIEGNVGHAAVRTTRRLGDAVLAARVVG